VPRYFFTVHDGSQINGPESIELPGLEAAKIEAIATAGALIRDSGKIVWDGVEWRMDVTDETGDSIFTLRFLADRLMIRQPR
jgi:hypothetical protein